MAELDNKTSIRVPSQLPEFIRDDLDYQTFVDFVEAYYEWMESPDASNNSTQVVNAFNQGVTFGSHNLLNYADVDNTLDDFIQYYINDFLPNFPEDSLSDKSKVLKLARQLYQTKGTPASYKLLFRLLYNSDAELLYTRDLVFRASSGEWYVPKFLKVKSTDLTWLSPKVKNLKLFGETSKSFAVIENIVNTNKSDKFNIYIAEIERIFLSGENIRVVDSANQDVYFKDGEIVPVGTQGSTTLVGKIVGAISSININPKYRGLKYRVGDPVVVYGGLNDTNGIGATAEIEETTKGSIQRLNLVDGGHGYRTDPNTRIVFTGGGGSGAIAHVQSVNTLAEMANVVFVGTDLIALKSHIQLDATSFNFTANLSANALTSIANSLSFISFSTSPIDSVIVDNGGGGYSDVPLITAESLYNDELPSQTLWIKDGTVYTSNVSGSYPISSNTHNLASIGILSPIKILNAGQDYSINDKIVFSGGTGSGAYANVKSVGIDGNILEIEYVPNYMDDKKYPIGGMGYTNQSLPTLSISSLTGSGANVYVSGILGTGALFNAQTDRIGSITKIKITEAGEDYVNTPNVSFKVQDLVITNINGDINDIKSGSIISQNTNNVLTYSAYVDSKQIITSTPQANTDVYRFRVYNYAGKLNYDKSIIVETPTSNVSVNLSNQFDGLITDIGAYYNGIKTYGNGSARGVAKFLQGLIFGAGRYISTVGQPSSYSVLQSEIHNDYTYILSVETPIAKYRDLLKSLLHPSGMRVIGRDLLKSEKNFDFHKHSGQDSIFPLQYWINWPVGDPYVSVSMNVKNGFANTNIVYVNSTDKSLNVFNNLSNSDFIIIENSVGPVISSKINSLDAENAMIYLDDEVWLTYSNVAYAYSNTELGLLQISDFSVANTPNYDIINNRNYSDANNHIKDIVFRGDNITIGGNTYIVLGVDYDNNLISIVNQQSVLATDPNADLVETNQPVANNILLGDYQIIVGTKENPVPFTINRKINTPRVSIRKSS